ncbi:type II toxin-antitoxin system CcdA family antitoxin [Trinickia dinghuensis]|uniref:Uncharacterized protein n=1 Tax=Trinickia dinghuensis TaxID=2291023 RepID=A0A3D8JS37_9BURK|nr:hypothetical protein DWV00_26780 [Trinickia dinghuensis]
MSLVESLLAEAKDLGLNVSQAAEAGLAKAVSDLAASPLPRCHRPRTCNRRSDGW